MHTIIDNIGLYRDGLLTTLQICLYAAIGSLVLGTVIAAFRVSPFPPLRATGTAWVTVFRNCPLPSCCSFAPSVCSRHQRRLFLVRRHRSGA